MTPPVRAMAVVVPAHNEEELLGACLDSVQLALRTVQVVTMVTVVLDRCTDGSAAIAREHAGRVPLLLIEGTFPSVGAARDAGMARAAQHLASIPAQQIWVANTDADSLVPVHWLERQRRLANAGMDLVLGTVEPGPSPSGHDEADRLWRAQHTLVEGHAHIHGANLGVRLSVAMGVGGFGKVQVSEDVELAHRVQSGTMAWCATDTTRVVTSSRRQGRASHGFAEFLRALDASLIPMGQDAGGSTNESSFS